MFLIKKKKIHHDVNPFVADRAIIWSNSVEDKSRLEDMGLFIIPGVGEVGSRGGVQIINSVTRRLFAKIAGLVLKDCHLTCGISMF